MFNNDTTVIGPMNWRYRDIITVSCKQGYSFAADMFTQSSVQLTCQYGGTWSRTIPRCQRKHFIFYNSVNLCDKEKIINISGKKSEYNVISC